MRGEAACPIASLPEELLVRVLEQLDFLQAVRAARVSRAWRCAVDSRVKDLTSVLPHHFPAEKGPSDQAIAWLTRRCRGVRSASLYGQLQPVAPELMPYAPSSTPYPLANPPGAAAAADMAEAWPNLERLEIESMCDKGVAVIAHNMPNLVALRLGKEDMQDRWLMALSQTCRRLRVLDLRTPGPLELVSDEGLVEIAMGCPELKDLNLSMCDCRLITRLTYDALAAHSRELRALSLPEPRFMHPGSALTALLLGCSKLTRLHMTVNRSHGVLRELAIPQWGTRRGFLQLRCLGLSLCMGLRDPDLVTLAMSFPGLETLRLSNLRSCHDGALQALGRGCPDLRSVDLQDARLISDAGVRALMDECAGIERVALEFVGVSDRLMLALARDATVAPRLQILDVLGTFAEASVDGPPLEEPVSAEGVRRLASVRPELKLRWRAGGTAEDAIKGGAAGHYATSHWPIPQEEISDRW